MLDKKREQNKFKGLLELGGFFSRRAFAPQQFLLSYITLE